MEEKTFDMYGSWKNDFWWVWSRRDLLRRCLEMIRVKKEAHIVDVGAGTGLLYPVMRKFGKVTSMEYSKKGVDILRKKGVKGVIQGDAQDLPFKDGSIDVVAAMDVMEHVDKDGLMVQEVHRVLKKGGHFIITVPAYMFLWSDDDVLVHHKRRYTLARLKKVVGKKGFKIRLQSYRYFFIFLPTLMIFLIKRLKKLLLGKRYVEKNSLEDKPSKIVNSILKWFMRLENKMILKRFYLPFGVNIVLVLKKK